MAMAMILSAVLLLVGICLLVVMHMCMVGRAFRRGLSTIGRGEMYNEKEKGLSPEEVERLPCFDFKIGGDKVVDLLDCAVCLESFQIGDMCRLLPACRHSFHAQCVDSWLMKTPICPICRRNAVVQRKDGEVSGVQHSGSRGDRAEFQSVVVGFSVASDSFTLHAS